MEIGCVDSVGVLPGLQSLWQDDLLLDYTIEVEDKEFSVHKAVIASVSEFFRAMLTGGMVESQTDRVRLEGQDALAVSNMIEFIYTHQFGENRASVEELLSCAVYLQIPSAKALCSKSLAESINVDNCFEIFSIFTNLSFEGYIEKARNYIKSNLCNICQKCKPDEMSLNGFISVMDFWGKSEWDNFQSAIKWIEYDMQNREQFLNTVMCNIHFAAMTPDELAKVKQTETFTHSVGSWLELVEEAIEYHKLPTQQKVNKRLKQAEVRVDPSPAIFTLDEDQYQREFYTAKDGRHWTKHAAVTSFKGDTAKREPFDEVCLLEVNNFLIIHTSSHKYHIFDPLTLEWSPMAGTVKPRKSCGLVYHDNNLYAFGGRVGTEKVEASDEIEKYDFETDTWHITPHKMPTATHCHRLCHLDGLIYVLGGFTTPDIPEMVHDFPVNFCSFNPSTGCWASKATLLGPAYYQCDVVVGHLDGQERIIVIRDSIRAQYYVPAEDCWIKLDFDPRNTCELLYHLNPVLYAKDMFYFLGCDKILTSEEREACHC